MYLKDEKMANHKQAIKRHKQSVKRRSTNRFFMSTMRTHLKRARHALTGEDKDLANDLVKNAAAYINKVASKGIIHRNKASRLVSRMSKRFNVTFEK
ncbi:30S ribosomal protein S20 [Myxococcota bacterium]|nr:30S ribosomal protein S20 [Myxococcota bacterium]MBU1536831.1 30S ribosomal protein S20 [Myxococcota bacterium]